MLALENPTCHQKQELAFELAWPWVWVNGNERETMVSNTNRNWFRPEMYYLAIMDCEENLVKTFGPETHLHGFIKIEADLKDQDLQFEDSEFSYDQQGILQVEKFLFAVYVFLVAMFFRDSMKENHEMQDINTPHWYALIGISL